MGAREDAWAAAPQTSEAGTSAAPAQDVAVSASSAPEEAAASAATAQHVHHSYIWMGAASVTLLASLYTIITMVPNIATAVVSAGYSLAVPIVFALIGIVLSLVSIAIIYGIVVFFRWLMYRNLSYCLDETEFNLHSGIITKQHVHVPYTRIQAVDQQASIFQRAVGVCTVRIDTAGGAANKAVRIPYVKRTQAEALRAELFARKAAAIVAGGKVGNVSGAAACSASAAGTPGATGAVAAANAAYCGDTKPSFEYGLRTKELVLTGLTNSTAFIATLTALLIGLCQLFSDAESFLSAVNANADTVIAWILNAFGGSVLVVMLIVLVGGTLIGWILNVITSCLTYGGFRARRCGTRIEVEHGVLQHQFKGADIDRVQSVTIRQTVLRRLIGYCEVSVDKIEAMDSGENKNGTTQTAKGMVVHPFARVADVPAILQGLVPELAAQPQPVRRLPEVSKRRAILRFTLWRGAALPIIAAIALMQLITHLAIASDPTAVNAEAFFRVFDSVCLWSYVLAVLVGVYAVFNGLQWYKETFYAYDDSFIVIRNGGFSTTTTIIPRKKVQFITLQRNPFQRRAGVALVKTTTAAGIGGTTVGLYDVDDASAEAWQDWAKPRHR